MTFVKYFNILRLQTSVLFACDLAAGVKR